MVDLVACEMREEQGCGGINELLIDEGTISTLARMMAGHREEVERGRQRVLESCTRRIGQTSVTFKGCNLSSRSNTLNVLVVIEMLVLVNI